MHHEHSDTPALAKGFAYLVAILDLATRRVMAWRLSNTMSSDFCIEALNEAITRYGAPEFFNTDQGSQFTSQLTRILPQGCNDTQRWARPVPALL